MNHQQSDAEEFAKLTESTASKEDKVKTIIQEVVKPSFPPSDDEDSVPRTGQVCQYSLYGPGYMPTTATVQSLPNGCYDLQVGQHGVFAIPALPPTGLLLELPEMRSDYVLGLIERFWNSEKDYKEGNEFVQGGAQYKAGVMIYGPPGSGKSCTIKIAARKAVERGATVFYASIHPGGINSFLNDFSRIERDRKTVVVLEDIDSLIHSFGESGYLEMLDSAKTINNVLFIATTNYPEHLDPRIYNRPGRFSHVVKIGHPTDGARRAFLKAILKNHRDVEEIVSKTSGFSIDHLSSLVNAVYREKKDLSTEIEYLRALWRVKKSDDGRSIGIVDSV